MLRWYSKGLNLTTSFRPLAICRDTSVYLPMSLSIRYVWDRPLSAAELWKKALHSRPELLPLILIPRGFTNFLPLLPGLENISMATTKNSTVSRGLDYMKDCAGSLSTLTTYLSSTSLMFKQMGWRGQLLGAGAIRTPILRSPLVYRHPIKTRNGLIWTMKVFFNHQWLMLRYTVAAPPEA